MDYLDKCVENVEEAVDSVYKSFTEGDLQGWEISLIKKRIRQLKDATFLLDRG